jgi:DNA-binding HxlR family transcriptional regulator
MAGPAATAPAEAPVSNESANGSPQQSLSSTGVCPYFHEAVELLGKRWTGAIVDTLLAGPKRFSEVSHAIPQISDRLLSTRLRELEACGIVTRAVYEESPVRVEYELTSMGGALEPAVTAIRSWAREWLQR